MVKSKVPMSNVNTPYIAIFKSNTPLLFSPSFRRPSLAITTSSERVVDDPPQPPQFLPSSMLPFIPLHHISRPHFKRNQFPFPLSPTKVTMSTTCIDPQSPTLSAMCMHVSHMFTSFLSHKAGGNGASRKFCPHCGCLYSVILRNPSYIGKKCPPYCSFTS